MKRLIMTALTAVFLSVIIQGCYTQFKSNEPKTGEKDYSNYQYYGDDYYYSPYYYGMGWYQPYFYYPYPSYYGYMYSPWWYDPWYYYYDDGTHYITPNNGSKAIRRGGSRGGTSPQSPGIRYSPQAPSAPSGGGSVESAPPPPPPSNSNPPDKKETKESGKSTRGRR